MRSWLTHKQIMFYVRMYAVTERGVVGRQEYDGDVIFLTGSRNMAVFCMRNEKYAIWPLRLAKSPKFLHLIGNRGRGTRG